MIMMMMMMMIPLTSIESVWELHGENSDKKRRLALGSVSNTGLSLVESDHGTLILASHWSGAAIKQDQRHRHPLQKLQDFQIQI